MAGMRVEAGEVDLEAFRRCVDDAGAIHEPPKPSANEVLRFKIDGALGIVSRRKSGHLTFAGIAKPLLNKWKNEAPDLFAAKREPKAAVLRTLTLTADDHAKARIVLADALKAEVHTDGSCEASGAGKGGWAAIIRSGFVTVEIYGGAPRTTVNRMEMIAAIAALEVLPPVCAVRLHTDSQYLRKGIKTWIVGWKRNGWTTRAGTPVKNAELWTRLDRLREGREVTWKWIRGHSGNRGNERADELARMGRLSVDQQKEEGEAA